MRFRRLLFVFLFTFVMSVSRSPAAEKKDSFENLKLTALDGQKIDLNKPELITVFAFLGNECPVARSYAAGFSSVLISETRDHRIFASLGIVTLVTGLLCDLFLLPALLAQFDRDSRVTVPRTEEHPLA